MDEGTQERESPSNAPLQFGKRLRRLFVAAFADASLSSEICSTLFHCSRDRLSFAAIDPKSAVHLVSTSNRRVGWLRPFVQTSCPSLLSSQLTNTLVALGWGRFLMITRFPDPDVP